MAVSSYNYPPGGKYGRNRAAIIFKLARRISVLFTSRKTNPLRKNAVKFVLVESNLLRTFHSVESGSINHFMDEI